MNLNSDSDDSDSGAEEPTCARSAAPKPGSSITRTPEGGSTWAGLEVGTRLLVWWESGWESGAVAEKVTPAMGGRAVDGVTPATLYRIVYDDGESCLHDLETLSVRLESSAAAAETNEAGEVDTWAQCERCEKWRKLPPSSNSALPEHWFCELNPDLAFASCEVAEEPWLDNDEDQQAAPPHDKNNEVEVEAVWEVVEEEASSPSSSTAPSSHGLAMRWKEASRWAEKSEKTETKNRNHDFVRRTVSSPRLRTSASLCPPSVLLNRFDAALPRLAQCARILRRGFEQMSITKDSEIEQMHRVLYSELNALLLIAREQQVPQAHDEGAAATLPRPELLAAMATVRDELATVRCVGTMPTP